jgi:AAA domain
MRGRKIMLTDISQVSKKIREEASRKKSVLIYGYNGTGKTRLSMQFKNDGKRDEERDTLYFNAFTEDLFYWENDIEEGTNHTLGINNSSRFLENLSGLSLEQSVRDFISEYTNFDFNIDYDRWEINFYNIGETENIKISRGEENIFMLGIFLAIVQLASDRFEAYDWVKYVNIDDPVSSLDDNNIISMAVKISKIIETSSSGVNFVISTHHSLFFNVLYNEIRRNKRDGQGNSSYLFDRSRENYSLEKAEDKPLLYHHAMLKDLKDSIESQTLYTYHFNLLRTLMENTAAFLNYDNLYECISSEEDKRLYGRMLNLYSHGGHSIYSNVNMSLGEKDLLKRVFEGFIEKHHFKVRGS